MVPNNKIYNYHNFLKTKSNSVSDKLQIFDEKICDVAYFPGTTLICKKEVVTDVNSLLCISVKNNYAIFRLKLNVAHCALSCFNRDLLFGGGGSKIPIKYVYAKVDTLKTKSSRH